MALNLPVVTRFAPSPTGFQHVGGMRTALYAWLWARKHNGTFILRIEDTDKTREVAGSREHLIESLLWLGIDWDYGPNKPGPFGSCIQSERLDHYTKWAQVLIEKGLAYPDPYTESELEAFRTRAKVEKRPFLYRDHRPTSFETWDGTKPLRLKVPAVKRYTWEDAARGTLSAGEEMLDDIILIKSDGYPTYNFAHIIDDYEMGVTHIMRSDEFISSTPKFLSIYDALGFSYPTFVTLPPILRDDRTKKLGKRDGAKDILEYRTEGYLPEAMMNFLALIGWNPGTEQELFTTTELIETFEIDRIHAAGAALNEEKLDWMNKQHLGKKPLTFQTNYFIQALPPQTKQLPGYAPEIATKLAPVALERIHNQLEIKIAGESGEYDFAFVTPTYDTALLRFKQDSTAADALPRLNHVHTLLDPVTFTDTETIKAAIFPYADEVGRGHVLWPLRVALSGRERSPDPFIIAYIIGKEETLRRISLACDKIRG